MNSAKITANRKFGLFFAFIFFFFSLYFGFVSAQISWLYVFLFGAVALFLISYFVPETLAPLNSAWMALGHLLGRIVSPIVLGLIFFVLITPVALMGRIAGRDPLHLKARIAASYWIKREPPGPTPDSFKNQF